MKTASRTPRVNDTSAAAAEVQIRLLRAMPASRKVGLVEDANRTARQLALAGIGLRFPEASEEERVRLLMSILLPSRRAILQLKIDDLRGEDLARSGVAVSPDGSMLAVDSWGIVKVYSLPPTSK